LNPGTYQLQEFISYVIKFVYADTGAHTK